MAGCGERQFTAVGELRRTKVAGSGHVRQASEGIEAGHRPGSFADQRGHGSHLLPQLHEQLVFPLAGAGAQLKNASFPLFEFGGDEAFFVGQGLATDPVVGHRCSFGFAHGEEVAEGAVVLKLQGADPADLAFLLFLLGEPSVLIVELVAEAVE